MSFSSQHGPIFSGDDFYVIGSGLVSLEIRKPLGQGGNRREALGWGKILRTSLGWASGGIEEGVSEWKNLKQNAAKCA